MPKILVETRQYEEIDIEYPLYAHVEEDEDETFVMIDENHFKQIRFARFTGRCEIAKYRSSNNLAAIWRENMCDKSAWEQAERQLKNMVSQF